MKHRTPPAPEPFERTAGKTKLLYGFLTAASLVAVILWDLYPVLSAPSRYALLKEIAKPGREWAGAAEELTKRAFAPSSRPVMSAGYNHVLLHRRESRLFWIFYQLTMPLSPGNSLAQLRLKVLNQRSVAVEVTDDGIIKWVDSQF